MSTSARRTTEMLATASSRRATSARPESSGSRSDWSGIAGDHHGRGPAQPGQQHLQLHVGAVLRLVDHHEGVVEGAAAHEADRGDLDGALGHQRPHPLHRQAVGEGVVERAQVGRELVLHLAGQEADATRRPPPPGATARCGRPCRSPAPPPPWRWPGRSCRCRPGPAPAPAPWRRSPRSAAPGRAIWA